MNLFSISLYYLSLKSCLFSHVSLFIRIHGHDQCGWINEVTWKQVSNTERQSSSVLRDSRTPFICYLCSCHHPLPFRPCSAPKEILELQEHNILHELDKLGIPYTYPVAIVAQPGSASRPHQLM